MKPILILFFSLFVLTAQAQFLDKLAKKAQKATERAIEKNTEQNATQATNMATEDVLNSKKPNSNSGNSNQNSNQNSDFVSGKKVLFEENFANDAQGDFPLNWFTNSSGSILSIDGKNWLQLSDKGSFCPTKLTKLTEDFTFEFDVKTTENFNFYSTPLNIVFAEKKNKADDVWNTVFKRDEAVVCNVHPANALAGTTGNSSISLISKNKEWMKNKVVLSNFNKNNNSVRVQIWRQKNRFRMYVDGQKYWDLPTAFSEANYNQILFFIGTYKKTTDKLFITNIRLAEASKDTRHELLETGSFSTNEILFDTNKATLKPSSKKTLDELGKALVENPTVRVRITGHTDNDGNDTENQKLSKKRAETVAVYFYANFKIVKARLETSGKGELDPIANNDTEDGKMQNRRVEFVIIE